MEQRVTCMRALHPHKYPKGVFPIDDRTTEIEGLFPETNVT